MLYLKYSLHTGFETLFNLEEHCGLRATQKRPTDAIIFKVFPVITSDVKKLPELATMTYGTVMQRFPADRQI